jgi:hypothetical protein
MRQFATIEMAQGGSYAVAFDYDLPIEMVGARLFMVIKPNGGSKIELEAIDGVVTINSATTSMLPVGKNEYQVYFLVGAEKYYQCDISTLVVKEVI